MTHTPHTLIQTFMQTSLLTHTYTFHPACELSQTNTRWLFCSWTGWPVSTAEGGHKGGGEWEWKSACWRPPLGQEDYQPVPCFSSPFSTSWVTFTRIGPLCRFPNSNVRCVGLHNASHTGHSTDEISGIREGFSCCITMIQFGSPLRWRRSFWVQGGRQ